MPWPKPTRKALASLSINRSSLHGLNPEPPTDEDLLLKLSQHLHKFCIKPPPLPSKPPRPLPRHPFEYNAAMKRSADRGDADRVLNLFDEMKRLKIRPDVACYTTVAAALVSSARPEAALTVFAEITILGIVPDVQFYTVMVKLYSCRLERFDLAYGVVWQMAQCGCTPDVVTYSTLIAGLCRAWRVDEALGVLDRMLEEQCIPNAHTYTPIVQGYCSIGRIDTAVRFLDMMESIGCRPNTVTYNVLIEALCRIGVFDSVEKVLDESSTKGWVPDEITYSLYMDGLCKRGMAHEAFEVLEVMIGKGLQPNAVTLNILLDCLCRGPNVSKAKRLLDYSADVVNYNTVMSRLCDAGQWRTVLKLFSDMFKKGIVANTRTFTIVIYSLCRGGKLQKAKCIFDSTGLFANVVTYTALIHHLCIAGETREAHRLFRRMREEKVAPNAITYGVMIDCLCRQHKFPEAVECFHRALEDGFSSGLVARLVIGLVRGGKVRNALNLIKQIIRCGLVIDVCIFRSLIKAFCQMGYCQSREMYKVCHILDKMLRTR